MSVMSLSRFFTTALSPLLLDLLPSAAGAYGLRLLRLNYTGAAIRVRRSTDDLEVDIGFTSTGDLNTSALMAHVGAGSGFVSIWYDQSGNAKDAIQATTGSQPRIVNSGVLDTRNRKPTIVFLGSKILVCASFSLTQPCTTYAIAQETAFLSSQIIAGGANTPLSGIYVDNTAKFYINSGTNLSQSTVFLNLLHAFSGVHNGESSVNTLNNVSVSGAGGSNGFSGLEIGSWHGGLLSLNGAISELILYSGAKTGSVAFSNQDSYFGIIPKTSYVFDGDSRTFGAGASSTDTSYPFQFRASIPGISYVLNDGVSGQRIDQFDSDASGAGGIDTRAFPVTQDNLITYLVGGGVNDIAQGASVATAYTRYKTLVANRRATSKYGIIVVRTEMPATNSTITTSLFALNDLIRAGMQPGGDLLAAGANLLMDVQQLPAFNSTTSFNNLTYYNADLLHLNDEGYRQLSVLAKSTLGL